MAKTLSPKEPFVGRQYELDTLNLLMQKKNSLTRCIKRTTADW